ncbi:MAG TPA: cytochrome-c peroxidase [Myxococcales bacterium]|jgi:cytochrome c peroxidase
MMRLQAAAVAVLLVGCGGAGTNALDGTTTGDDAGTSAGATDAGTAGGATDGGTAIGGGTDAGTGVGAPFEPMALSAAALPASPTNFAADLPAAAALGQRLFADARMSSDGTVSCQSCHSAAQGFSDARQVSVGVLGHTGTRHAPSVVTVALTPFLFWDGRADSAWSQPLKAIEGAAEMDFSRTEVATLVLSAYRADYEAIFGPIPDLGTLPARAMPGLPAWNAMTAEQQDGVQRIFSDVGKSLEAYERKLTCADTRFDRWARGEITLTAAESAGAQQFVNGRCIACHSGQAFSDGAFHDLGLSPATGASDAGRSAGSQLLLGDAFNGAGAYSDDIVFGQTRLDTVSAETGTVGAFRTGALRGVGQRPRFGHAGQFTQLDDFLRDAYNRPRLHAGTVGTLDPKLAGVNLGNIANLIAFLRTLDCPPVAADLLP